MKNVCIMLAACLCAAAVYGDGGKGASIARGWFDLKKPADVSARATMVLIDRRDNRRTRNLDMYTQRTAAGTATYIEFTGPADVAGTRFLSLPREGSDDEQRLYLPALKKARTIASASKNGSFVGSDFSYYDLEDRSFEDYSYIWLRDEEWNGRWCRVIEMIPAGSAPYSRAEAWVDTADSYVHRMQLYDRGNGAHLKTMTVVETALFDGCIVPVRVVMENIRESHKTLLSLSELQVNRGLDARFFSVAHIERK